MSMGRPLKACATRLAPAQPTGATTLTGRIKLAERAKYTAEPPSVSSTMPKGPSRVSSATEPATRSSRCRSGTAPCAAAGRDYVSGMPQLLQEVLWARVVLDLHPAPSQLARSMCVRACCNDFAQVDSEARRRLVCARLAPCVVGLDDVDSIRQLDDALWGE